MQAELGGLSGENTGALVSPNSGGAQSRLVWDLFFLLGAAAGYYVCAVVGTVLSVPPTGFAIIWPATAFLISIFLVSEPRYWWLCVAGVIPTHFYLAATFQPNAPLIVILTQISGNLLLALATAFAVRSTLGPKPRFDTLNSVLAFIGIAAICTPAIVNSIILAVHLSTGWISNFWLAWWQWMIAVIFPTATIPLLVSMTANGRLVGYTTDSARPEQELSVLILLLFGATYVAYGGVVQASHWPVLLLVPFPFLLWAAVRLGVGGTCLSLLVFSAATIIQALRHNGPFAINSPIDDVISLQTYFITTSIPLILIAALMDERRQAVRLLQQSEARMQMVASDTDTGFWKWDANLGDLWLTDHCRQMMRLPATPGMTPYSLLDAIVEEDRNRVRQAFECALNTGIDPASEEYRVDGNGEARWLLLSMHSEVDETGHVSGISGVVRDITERRVAQLAADRLRRKIGHLREDERRRIAEELHDSTAQHLVAAGLSLANVNARVRSPRMRAFLSDAIQSVREASQEIRTFSYLLHPPHLGSSGLSAVLRQYVPGFERRTGVHTSLRLSSLIDRLPADQQHVILRIVQESLGNVHRHAGARNVWVSVRCVSGNVHLVVRDDGKGIEASAGKALSDRLRLGVGIPAMSARAKRVGGRIDVKGRSSGTAIHVTIPLPRRFNGSPH